jgi:hypothetical protein
MTGTDLAALVQARCAEKIAAGKSPTKADLAWLAATEVKHAESAVEISRNAKGDVQFNVKAYHADVFIAEANAKEIVNRLRATYPMSDGTVGSPMVTSPTASKRPATDTPVASRKAP